MYDSEEECRQAVVGGSNKYSGVYHQSRSMLSLEIQDTYWSFLGNATEFEQLVCFWIQRFCTHRQDKETKAGWQRILLYVCRILDDDKGLSSDWFQNKQIGDSANSCIRIIEQDRVRQVVDGHLGQTMVRTLTANMMRMYKLIILKQDVMLMLKWRKRISHHHRSLTWSQRMIWIWILKKVLKRTISPTRLWCRGREDMMMKILLVVRIMDDIIWEGIRN